MDGVARRDVRRYSEPSNVPMMRSYIRNFCITFLTAHSSAGVSAAPPAAGWSFPEAVGVEVTFQSLFLGTDVLFLHVRNAPVEAEIWLFIPSQAVGILAALPRIGARHEARPILPVDFLSTQILATAPPCPVTRKQRRKVQLVSTM